jgi:hypothetical protein
MKTKKINIKYRLTFNDRSKTVIETNRPEKFINHFEGVSYTQEEINKKADLPDFEKYASMQVEQPLLIIEQD